jgi:hypothetical protein
MTMASVIRRTLRCPAMPASAIDEDAIRRDVQALCGSPRASARDGEREAVIADAFDDVIRFTRPPRAVQRVLFAVLAPLGRARGRRATYPHHRGVVITLPDAGAAPPA